MRNITSQEPALVRYFRQVAYWVNWAWAAYRTFEKIRALVEVVFM